MRFCLYFIVFLFSLPTFAQIEGKWYTILNAMGTELPIGLELERTDSGFAGVMTSPAQTKGKIPLTSVTLTDRKVVIKESRTGVTLDLVLDGKTMKGIYNQANQDFPVAFTRHVPRAFPVGDDPVTIRARPQDPTNFPYQRETVTFPGGAEGVTLAGELTLPEKGKPRALVVLVSGSGPQDRNAYLGSQINHSPFLVLSDYLTRRGYGVLRYDERGIGESTGDFGAATTYDLAADAAAAVAYLEDRPKLKNVPVGVAGHSEGGMIAPVVASQNEELDFVLLLAAPAIPIDSLMLDQRRRVARAMGQPEVLVRRDEPALRAAYAFIKDNPQLNQEAYIEGLYDLFEAQLVNLPEPLRKSIVDKRAFNAQYVKPLSSPWMRNFIAFNPQNFLERLTIPVLAINGLKDTQVDGLTNLNAVSAALAKAGNEDVTVVPLVDLNHLFQPADTGSPTEYGTIETTFDEGALKIIGDWLAERY